ncbi:hypothetical protein [Nonomuraea sp. LPB2021202275-12-8]|uniref:hypothetical protein n=1 Tax=Nonomuraea sp. LPB2021202275-12-8 TaxID=3120159 RepID=UPI00300D39A1
MRLTVPVDLLGRLGACRNGGRVRPQATVSRFDNILHTKLLGLPFRILFLYDHIGQSRSTEASRMTIEIKKVEEVETTGNSNSC